MPEGLKRKVGPLPLWAWALIAGAAIGGFILYTRNNQGSGGLGAPVDDNTQLDPTTGQTTAGEGSGAGALVGGGTAPTLAQEISDVTGVLGTLRDSGLFAPPAQDGTSATLIALAPGTRYYDPITGETVDGPAAAAVNQVTPGKTGKTAAAKPTALDRAMTAVQSGKVGKVNRTRLRKAGFSDAQIDYHAKHKTPLGKPAKAAGPGTKTPKTVAPHSANNHQNVKAPDHSKAERPRIVAGKDSHGRPGAWHIYSDHRVFVHS